MALPQYKTRKGATLSTVFNYTDPYGSNPYVNASQKLWELINRVTGQPGGIGLAGSASTGASYGSLETNVARPGDPEVRDYMSNVVAGQRNTLDEYVRRAAGAGSGRAVRRTAGGLPSESSLYDKAMKTLAGGYEDRFREAMDYNKYSKTARSREYSDTLRNLQDLLGMHYRYLTSQADWQNRLADRMLAERRADRDADLTAAERRLALERMRQLMETERWRSYMEKQDRTRPQKAQDDLEMKFAELADKMGINQFGAGLSPRDQLWAERVGVDLKYLKPWQRSLSVKMGNK